MSLDGNAIVWLVFIFGSQILGYGSRHGGHALMLWCPMEWECRCNRKLEQPARRFQREGESMTTQTSMAMASNVDDHRGLGAKCTRPDPRAKRRKSVGLSSSPPPPSQSTSLRMQQKCHCLVAISPGPNQSALLEGSPPERDSQQSWQLDA